MTRISGNIYKLSLTVLRDRRVWFKIQGDEKTYFTIDLTSGDVSVTKQSNGNLTVVQDGFVISDFDGSIYLTYAGHSTANQVIVQSDDGANGSIDIFVNKITADSTKSIFEIDSGSVDISFGDADNIIRTSQGSPFYVSQSGSLNIITNGKRSVIIDGESSSPSILGEGSVTIDNGLGGGFLNLNKNNGSGNDVPNLSVGTYTYVGNDAKYTATLYDGNYTYTLIGYISGNRLFIKEDIKATNNKNFSARGVLEVFNGVKTASDYSISNGYLTVTLTLTSAQADTFIGEITCQAQGGVNYEIIKDGTVIGDDGTTTYQTYTVKIPVEAFINGNVKLLSAANGKIAYSVQSYSGVYDGSAIP